MVESEELKESEKLKDLNQKIEKKLKSSLLVINKKRDITSADEVYELRRIFKNKERVKKDKIKIGHSGTLDPKVTGVLVIGLGKGTRVLEYILLSEKVYEAEIIFHQKVSRKDFQKALEEFTGTITQLPPVKSAVKREKRKREVYDLKLTFFAPDGRSAKFISAVERGTYIRTLCHDMGQFLDTGAHMGDLKRTKAGVFSNKNSKIIKTREVKKLYNSEKAKDKKELLRYFYDIEEIFQRLSIKGKIKKVFVKEEAVKYIKAGNAVRFYNLDVKKTLKEASESNLKINNFKSILEKENNTEKINAQKENAQSIDWKKYFKKEQNISIFYKDKVLAVGFVESALKEIDDEDIFVKLKKVF